MCISFTGVDCLIFYIEYLKVLSISEVSHLFCIYIIMDVRSLHNDTLYPSLSLFLGG